MQRVKVSLLCLLSLSLAGVLAAQTAVDPNSDVGSASLQDFSGGATLRGTYFDVRYMSGDGVGYKNGYTQIGTFTPFWLNEDSFIAPNARILLTDNSDVGANGGLVARHYDWNRDRIWGVNGYYDTDVSQYGNRYNQFGLGFETLGQFLDFRANGYVPTGDDKNIIGPVGLSPTPFFFENRIGFIGTRLMEQALRGGDFEVGVPVTAQTPWLRAFAGGYAYQQDGGDDPVGFRGRLEAWVSNDLSLGVNVTWDKQFDTNVNFVADWRFSGFLPTRYFPQWTTRERMLMPVQRHWRTTVGHYTEEVNVLAYNPRDDQPYFVVWVDNSAGGTNAGTFENPYNTTLPNAVPNETDLVLVRRGNTTEAMPLNGSITLPDYARMLGEGKPHVFDAYANYGAFHVALNDAVLPDPAFNDAANVDRYPFLTNTNAGLNGGDIIRLGNHNEVSAFVLEDATGRGIYGNNVAGFHLNNLEITGNIGGGIRLENATGTGPVTLDGQVINGGVISNINRNPVAGWSFAGTGLGDNAAGGIFVDTGAAGLNLAITNVAMNANPASQLFGINLQADDGSLATTLTDVQTDGVAPGFGNTTAGIILAETGQSLIAELTNVSASSNTGDGLQITGTNGTIQATIFDSGSIFNGNGGSGIVYTHAGGTGTLDIFNIEANTNGLDGLGLFGSVATVMNVNVHDSFLNGNTRDGIHVEEVGGATVNLFVDPTEVTFNGRDGFFFNVAGNSRLNATFLETNLSDNTRNAINGTVAGASIVNLSLTDSPGDRSGEDGFVFDVNGAGSELNVVALRSSFSNSGQGGVTGSGIMGTITNGGLVTFGTTTIGGLTGFTGSPISNNLENGMFVTATGLSNFQGSFTDSPFDDNGNTTASDGIRLDLDNSPNSSLDLLGTTTVNRNGNNGFELNANNGTVFISNFTGIQIVDNGQDAGGDGVQVNVDAVAGADSTVTQIFNNVTITNTAPPGPQDNGYRFTVGNGGDLDASFTGGSLSDNLVSAVNGAVTGTGVAGESTANVALDGVVADNSGGIGIDLTVTNAGLLEFGALNGTSISDSGLDGIGVQSSGANSVANLELDGTLNAVVIDGNGTTGVGRGVFATVSVGGTLNVCLDASSVSGNADQGINVAVTDLNSIARFGVEGYKIDGNGDEGLLANVSNQGTLHYRSIDSTYDGNGLNGVFDGVQINADGAGTTVLTLFSTDPLALANTNSSSNNTDDGYEFNATNGATLTASLDTTTATGNAGYGVNFNASGATTNANLLMTGANDLTGNDSDNDTVGGPLNVNVGAINSTVISLSGSWNNTNGDGIFIDLNGVANAVVAIQGPGTIDGSLDNGGANPEDNGDGIDVRMTNITNSGSILISGLTSINDSAADGIHLVMDNVASGAIQILGPTDILNSGEDAIDISILNGTVLDGAPALAATPIDVLTLTDSLATPLNGCLPDPVSTTLGGLNLVATEALQIDSMAIDNSGGGGIVITAVGSQISGNGILLTNNTVTGSVVGDGLSINLNNVSGTPDLTITDSQFADNFGNGVSIDLTNSDLGNVIIEGNRVGQSSLAGLFFFVPDVSSFSITNQSQVGVDLTSFTLDLSTITVPPGLIFDTVEPGISTPFTPIPPTDVTTGLATVNGNPYPSALPGNGVPDNSTLLNLTFNDFNAGENFDWIVDLDFVGQPGSGVTGDDLIGAAVSATFTSGGPPLTGFLVAVPGNPNASQFQATGGSSGTAGFSGNGLDGIRISQDNSNIASVLINDNDITDNGLNGTGHGINYASVINSDITNVTIRNNNISSNAGDGFRLVNPNTTGTPIDLTFEDNTISGNTDSGVNVQVNNAEQVALSFNSVTTVNNISSNGDIGISVTTRDTASFNLTMGGTGPQNIVEANGGAGIGILMLNTGAQGGVTSTFDIANTSASDNLVGTNLNFTGQGLGVVLRGTSVLDGGTVITSNFDGNAAEGARFVVGGDNLGNFSELNNLTLGGASLALGNTFSDNLTNDGIEFFRTADGEITNAQILSNTIEGNGINGLYIEAANASKTDTYTVNGNAINGNSQNGILFDIRADADIVANLDLNTITTNGNDGIRVIEQINNQSDSRTLGGTWTRNLITNNTQNGIRLNGFTTGLMIGDATDINLGNVISQNTQNGVLVTSPGDVTIGSNVIQENGTLANLGTANENAGVMLNVQPLSSVVTVTNNVITDNFGDGIQYSIASNFFGFSAQVAMTDNVISSNRGRGIDLINRGASYTQADISGNTINNNLLEGVYIVNTSSNTQNQFSSSTTALLNDGSVSNSRPILEVRFNDNEVNSNGINSSLSGTGLVVRVGTSNGGFGSGFDGGFASSGSALAVGAGPFGLTSGRGGVTMTVDNSDFSGNFGDDILFHSYVSTGNPNTGTTWDQTTFNTTGYQSDPLSRFDLYFRNNTYDTVPDSFDPVGTSLGGFGARNPALVAFYNNSDGVFKSRLNTIAAPNIAGPFNSAVRARNATRLAARIPNFSAPGSPVGASFLYPGMGESTWRISSDTTDSNFILDTAPYTTTNDANGNFLNGIGANGELPFGWGQF